MLRRIAFALSVLSAALAPALAVPPAAHAAPGTFNGRIAFTMSTGVGNEQIYTVNPDGSALTNLSNDPAVIDWYPVWSPDGTKIAFQSNRGSTPGAPFEGLYVMDADGGNVHLIASGGFFGTAWSGDGSKIAYVQPITGTNTCCDIWTVNADGTNPTDIISDGSQNRFPSFSPGGTKLVFDRTGTSQAGLWSANADGSGQVRLTDDSTGIDQKASFSPDGNTIVFNRVTYGVTPPSGSATGSQLWTMNPDGSHPTQLTNLAGFNAWPRYSPDGTSIVFQQSTTNSDSNNSLAVMRADGSGLQTVLNNGADNEFADWQPLNLDPNGTFVPMPPARILDTRTTQSPIGPNASIDVQASGQGGIPNAGVSAVVVNITATQPTAGSYLTAFPTGAAVPLASNLNFSPGQTVPNLVVVKLGTGGKFSLYNAQGSTHVIADVVGWYAT